MNIKTRTLLDNARRDTSLPSYYKDLSDEELYYVLQKAGRIESDETDKNFHNEALDNFSSGQTDKALTGTDDDLSTIQRYADYAITEESGDMWKAAYTRSLTGMAEQMITGKARYNVDEGNLSFWEDVGASFFSFLMPLDIATMFLGGAAGKLMTTGIRGTKYGGLAGRWMNQKIVSKAGQKAIGKGASIETVSALTKVERALLGGLGQAPALSLYEGAMGGVHAKINGENVWAGITHGVVHGAAMGALTGFIGGGMGARAAEMAMASKSSKKVLNLFDKAKMYGVYGKPGQIFAESGVFTGASVLDQWNKGIDVWGENGEKLLRTWAHNAALFTVLKTYGFTKHKAWDATKKVTKEAVKDTSLYKSVAENIKILREETHKLTEKEESLDNSIENVKENLESQGIETDGISNELAKKHKKNIAVDEILKESQESLLELDEIINSNDKGRIENDGKAVADKVVANIHLAETVLDKIVRGTEIDVDITEQQRALIKEHRDKLENLNDNLRQSFEDFTNKSGLELTESYLRKRNIDKDTNEEIFDLKDFDFTDKGNKFELDKKISEHERERKRAEDPSEKDGTQKALEIDDTKIINDASSRSKDSKSRGLNPNTNDQVIDKISKGFKGEEGSDKLDNIDKIHRKILVDVFGEKNRRKEKSKAIDESIEFLGWVKKKFGKDITNLEASDLDSLVIDYIHEKVHGEMANGRGMFNLRDKSYKGSTFEKNGYTKAEMKSAIQKAKNIRDKVRELDKDGLVNKFIKDGHLGLLRLAQTQFNQPQELKASKKEIILGRIDPKTGKEMSREQAIKHMASEIEKIDFVEVGTGKNKQKITGKEAAFMIRKASEHNLRGNEIPNIKIMDIEIVGGEVTGKIEVQGKGASSRRAINDIELAQFLLEKAREQGLDFTRNRDVPILIKEGSGNFSKLIKKAAEIADVNINVRHGIEGKNYAIGEKDSQGASVMSGISVADIFRRFKPGGEGEYTDLAKEAAKRGHTSTKATPSYAEQAKESAFTEAQLAAKKFKAGDKVIVEKKEYEIKEIKTIDGENVAFLKGRKNPLLLTALESAPTARQVAKAKERKTIAKEEQESQKDYFEGIPSYKNLRIKLEKDLGSYKGGKVLGRIRGHLIEVVEGKSRPDTIPHEVSHYVVDILKEFGTAKDKSLINKGSKMFGSEEALVQQIGEFAAGRMTNKTLMSKARTFIKDFWTRVKSVFGTASKQDIAWMLSKKVTKGDIPTGREVYNHIESLKANHQLDSAGNPNKVNWKSKETASTRARQLKRMILEDNPNKKEDIRAIEKLLGLKKGWKNKDTDLETLDLLVQELTKEFTKQEKDKNEIKSEAEKMDVSASDLESWAKLLGRPDGDYTKLTPANKKRLLHYIETYGEEPSKIETSTDEIITMGIKAPFVKRLARKFAPVYHILRAHGGKAGNALADRFIGFDVLYNRVYKAKGDVAGHEIRKLLGRVGSERAWMFDLELAEKRKVDGLDPNKPHIPALTKGELGFLGRLKEGAVINGVKNHISKAGEVVGTREYRAFKIHESLMDYYWNSIFKEVSALNNKVGMENFKREFGKKFVQGYMNRRITKQAYNALVEAKGGKILETAISDGIKDSARMKSRLHANEFNPKLKGKSFKEKMNNKKYKKNYEDKYKEFTEKNKDGEYKTTEGKRLAGEVAKDIHYVFTHKHHKVTNKNLIERLPILDAYIKLPNGKVIKTYETDLTKTLDAYVMTMSKYLATIRYFPEYTGLGSKYKLGSSKLNLLETQIHDKSLGKYAHSAIKKLIGVNESDAMYVSEYQALSTFTRISAAAGLSSPLSGIKNLLIGVPRNIASYGFYNTAYGMAKVFHADTWDKARAKGALRFGVTTLGLKESRIEAKGLKWVSMKNLFNVNLMQFTENINRIIGIEAGKMYFSQQMNILQGKGGLFGSVRAGNADRVMRDIWRLNERQRELVKKEHLETEAELAEFADIIRQVEHYSHISTQGGTNVGDLPLWMSGKIAKPLTLFQRIAYSTTWDTYQNYFKPMVTHGNIMPMARAVLSHTLSGMALHYAYGKLLGVENPVSSGDDVEKLAYYLWKSEAAGLAGFVFDPFDKGVAKSLFYPVVVRNLYEAREAFNDAFYKGRGLKSITDFGKKTFVVYGQYDRMIRNSKSPQYLEAKKWGSRRIQFMKDKGFTFDDDYNTTSRSFLYQDMKESVYWGTKEEFLKSYFAAYNTIVTEMGDQPVTPAYRHKKAIQFIRTSLKTMNPLKVKAKTPKGVLISKRTEYLNWVKKTYGEAEYKNLLKAEKDYQYLMRKVEKYLRNDKVWLERSVTYNKELNYK